MSLHRDAPVSLAAWCTEGALHFPAEWSCCEHSAGLGPRRGSELSRRWPRGGGPTVNPGLMGMWEGVVGQCCAPGPTQWCGHRCSVTRLGLGRDASPWGRAGPSSRRHFPGHLYSGLWALFPGPALRDSKGGHRVARSAGPGNRACRAGSWKAGIEGIRERTPSPS